MTTPLASPIDSYYQSKALSRSAINLLLECPALYKAWIDNTEGEVDTDAMKFGRMAHTLLLEPEAFNLLYAVTDLNLATTAGKKWKSELPAGISIVKVPEYEKALQMAEAVRDHPQAKHLFKFYRAEQSIYWTRDGIECKARPDMLSIVHGMNVCADYKTTESVNPEAIRRTIAKYHLHRQAAWYLDGLAATGRPCEYFIFIFQEKEYPFLVTMCILDEEALEQGKRDCERAIESLKECRASGLYPCYTRDILTISLPRWAVAGDI